MKENGIKSKCKAKWKATTNSNHNLPVAPNLLEQDFNIKVPNTVWVGDITYNWTEEGWLCTATVKDLCTKDVVGYAIGDRITKELVIKAMKMALRKERPKTGLIFHSDYTEEKTMPKIYEKPCNCCAYYFFFGIVFCVNQV